MENKDKVATEHKTKAFDTPKGVDDKARKAEIETVTKDVGNASNDEPVFTIDELRASALNLFGISQSTYDAATYQLRGKFTVGAMRQEIKKWLKEGY